TNVPLQRLFFLNSPFVEQQAEALAKRVAETEGEEARVRKAFEFVLQRDPSAEELKDSLDLLQKAPAPAPKVVSVVMAKPEPSSVLDTTPEPLKALCWALLSSNEFLFLN